jgi:aminomethyltransferase
MGFDAGSMGEHFGDPQGEAIATREACCVFDFSFLSRARVDGPDSLASVSRLTGRDLSTMQIREIRYALRTDPDGHALTDLTIWKMDPTSYEVFSGAESDIDELASFDGQVQVSNLGCNTAVVALQGPKSLEALSRLCDIDAVARLPYFTCCEASVGGIDCLVGRLGYTGEAGFELVTDKTNLKNLWTALCAVARPAGFQAADILRIEAGFPLFANEFRIPVMPSELGLHRFGPPTQAAAPALRLVSFMATEAFDGACTAPSPPPQRPTEPGTIAVTSTCRSPLAGGILGLGFVNIEDVTPGALFVDPAARLKQIRLVSHPFYDINKRRPRMPWPGI